MLKENRTQTLIKVETEEATTYFDAPASQDEASYDGNISKVDEEDIDIVPDKVDDAQIHNEGQEVTNKEDDSQTLKLTDEKPVRKQQLGTIWILRWSSQLQLGCSCQRSKYHVSQ